MRMARDAGDISSLFPPGVDSLLDLPFTIFQLIQRALYYVSFDQLPKEEQPPKWMWEDEELMTEWWEGVEKKREERTNDRPDLSHMSQNAAVEELLGKRRGR